MEQNSEQNIPLKVIRDHSPSGRGNRDGSPSRQRGSDFSQSRQEVTITGGGNRVLQETDDRRTRDRSPLPRDYDEHEMATLSQYQAMGRELDAQRESSVRHDPIPSDSPSAESGDVLSLEAINAALRTAGVENERVQQRTERRSASPGGEHETTNRSQHQTRDQESDSDGEDIIVYSRTDLDVISTDSEDEAIDEEIITNLDLSNTFDPVFQDLIHVKQTSTPPINFDEDWDETPFLADLPSLDLSRLELPHMEDSNAVEQRTSEQRTERRNASPGGEQEITNRSPHQTSNQESDSEDEAISVYDQPQLDVTSTASNSSSSLGSLFVSNPPPRYVPNEEYLRSIRGHTTTNRDSIPVSAKEANIHNDLAQRTSDNREKSGSSSLVSSHIDLLPVLPSALYQPQGTCSEEQANYGAGVGSDSVAEEESLPTGLGARITPLSQEERNVSDQGNFSPPPRGSSPPYHPSPLTSFDASGRYHPQKKKYRSQETEEQNDGPSIPPQAHHPNRKVSFNPLPANQKLTSEADFTPIGADQSDAHELREFHSSQLNDNGSSFDQISVKSHGQDGKSGPESNQDKFKEILNKRMPGALTDQLDVIDDKFQEQNHRDVRYVKKVDRLIKYDEADCCIKCLNPLKEGFQNWRGMPWKYEKFLAKEHELSGKMYVYLKKNRIKSKCCCLRWVREVWYSRLLRESMEKAQRLMRSENSENRKSLEIARVEEYFQQCLEALNLWDRRQDSDIFAIYMQNFDHVQKMVEISFTYAEGVEAIFDEHQQKNCFQKFGTPKSKELQQKFEKSLKQLRKLLKDCRTDNNVSAANISRDDSYRIFGFKPKNPKNKQYDTLSEVSNSSPRRPYQEERKRHAGTKKTGNDSGIPAQGSPSTTPSGIGDSRLGSLTTNITSSSAAGFRSGGQVAADIENNEITRLIDPQTGQEKEKSDEAIKVFKKLRSSVFIVSNDLEEQFDLLVDIHDKITGKKKGDIAEELKGKSKEAIDKKWREKREMQALYLEKLQELFSSEKVSFQLRLFFAGAHDKYAEMHTFLEIEEDDRNFLRNFWEHWGTWDKRRELQERANDEREDENAINLFNQSFNSICDLLTTKFKTANRENSVAVGEAICQGIAQFELECLVAYARGRIEPRIGNVKREKVDLFSRLWQSVLVPMWATLGGNFTGAVLANRIPPATGQ